MLRAMRFPSLVIRVADSTTTAFVTAMPLPDRHDDDTEDESERNSMKALTPAFTRQCSVPPYGMSRKSIRLPNECF